jgi:hypothetical protein
LSPKGRLRPLASASKRYTISRHADAIDRFFAQKPAEIVQQRVWIAAQRKKFFDLATSLLSGQ